MADSDNCVVVVVVDDHTTNNETTTNQTAAMPAMPKEKSSILAENNYTTLRMKEHLLLNGAAAKDNSSNSCAAACLEASNYQIDSNRTVNNRQQHHHQQQPQQQQQQQQTNNQSANTNNASPNNTNSTTTTGSTANSNSTNSTTTPQSGNRSNGGGSPAGSAPGGDDNNQQQQPPPPSSGHPSPAANGASGEKFRTAFDFRFGKSIGTGSFSTVYLAKDIHTRKEYAIKVCEKKLIIREGKQIYIKRERESMHLLRNTPGFAGLFCTFQDEKSLYFVLDYAENGDLLPHLNKCGSFDLQCSQYYAAELVLALEIMHRRGIVHRDLKPENILLNEKMHTMIADFGSSKIMSASDVLAARAEQAAAAAAAAEAAAAAAEAATSQSVRSDRSGSGSDTDSDLPASFMPPRQRKNSFVGTAQYVSPEMLNGLKTTNTCDLWSLGCIIYQMIAGLPPFRAAAEMLIFKKIMKSSSLVFPEGFDANAADLVTKLLQIDPAERLGANDAPGCYNSIRSHPFFAGIDWLGLRDQQPPPLHPFLPGTDSSDEDSGSEEPYRVPDHLETGLGERQLARMLGLELGMECAMPTASSRRQQQQQQQQPEEPSAAAAAMRYEAPKNILQISAGERAQRIAEQRVDNKWHQFVGDEVILKQGFINKRKGLFARKRMFLLTTGPRLVYVDPVQMVKKGEIPWSAELRTEPKNFKIFFVHTPNRTYYLEDTQGFALEWCKTIDEVRMQTYEPSAMPRPASHSPSSTYTNSTNNTSTTAASTTTTGVSSRTASPQSRALAS